MTTMPPVLISCASTNFRPGRPAGFVPVAIVLHRSGTRDALRARFNDVAAGVSAHYVVARDGSIDQYVRETDTAFHAGRVLNPVWTLFRQNVNPNFYTIGVELEGGEAADWPDVQIASASTLIAAISVRWQFPIDRDHVVAHHAIRASSRCPAPTCPIERIIAAAQRSVADHVSEGEENSSPSTDAMELAHATPPAPTSSDVSGMVIDRTTFALSAKEYFPDVTRKDLVVLHFTAGTSARSAFDTWRNDPQHIATSYVVDVNGAIYEVFPPSMWACHLGVKGTNFVHDRRSIGIEIANVGPLQPDTNDPDILNWWPRKSKNHPDFSTLFCRRDEANRYVKADFRGKAFFASFPDVQVDAVAALVRHLCERFAIPSTLPPAARRFNCDVSVFANYKGVCTHANFRQDKWDIGPAFPWDRLGL